MIEWICRRRSFFLFLTYPCNASRVWEACGIGRCEPDEQKDGEQVRGIVPVESPGCCFADGESSYREDDGDGGEGPK